MKSSCMVFLVIYLSALNISHASAEDAISVGKFSSQQGYQGSLPEGWVPLFFKKIKAHTQYTLIENNGIMVIKATSRASSSALRRTITINPKTYPIIRWRWKTEKVITKGDVAKKSGDDYSARLYITFQYDGSRLGLLEKVKFHTAKAIYGEFPPIGAISYIWDNKTTPGTFIKNAYTERVMMVVVESGRTKLNSWVYEQRDIYNDYKKAFGEEPPLISGVAIMTDTDNTGEAVTTFYGDIIFEKAK